AARTAQRAVPTIVWQGHRAAMSPAAFSGRKEVVSHLTIRDRPLALLTQRGRRSAPSLPLFGRGHRAAMSPAAFSGRKEVVSHLTIRDRPLALLTQRGRRSAPSLPLFGRDIALRCPRPRLAGGRKW